MRAPAFPAPYADELLYSMCARWTERMGYADDRASARELFGSGNAAAVVDLPCRLGRLATALPPGHRLTVDRIIDEHTLLPFYERFLPRERSARLREDMASDGGGKSLNMRAGIMASGIRAGERRLNWCPRCAQHERDVQGEAYWHRTHQAPGVLLCPLHAVPLVGEKVAARGAGKPYVYRSAESVIPRGIDDVNTNEHLSAPVQVEEPLRLARDAAWLLSSHASPEDRDGHPDLLRDRYLSLLCERGLATTGSRRVRVRGLMSEFEQRYDSELLDSLGCRSPSDAQDNWLLRLARASDSAIHPVQHLLLIHLLDHTADSFFAGVGADAPPEAPRMSEVRTPALVGLRSECAAEVGTADGERALDADRWNWLRLLAEMPGLGVKALRESRSGLYARLYRRDREWLRTHTPPRVPRTKVAPGRVDWGRRDAEIAGYVTRAADELLDGSLRPVAITKSALARRSGAQAIIEQHLPKLPLTEAAIAARVETREEYALRRVAWAIRIFREERVAPTPGGVIQRSGVNRIAHLPAIRAAVDRAVAELKSSESPLPHTRA